MVKEQNLKDKVREKLDENTPFKNSQWKRLEIEEKGKKKYVTKILETTLAKQKSRMMPLRFSLLGFPM
jgi:CDP-diacylglycerol pyrophosphatase